jgi:hypothetical protein
MRPTHLAILHAASFLVPEPQRAEWFAEWSAELAYVTHHPTSFCLGAFRDGLWFRRNHSTHTAHAFGLESPLRCIAFLALLAAASTFLAFRLPLVRQVWAKGHLLPAYILNIFISLLVVSATTSLALGEYPGRRHFRRRLFLAIKIALLLPIVCCGTLDVAALVSLNFQAHGLLIGLILGFRWALVDQRRRCPVCLRILAHPTRIGGPARTFLDWYGTELICTQGHGLLYVPEIPTSCYTTQRWQSLDPSWTSLFEVRQAS